MELHIIRRDILLWVLSAFEDKPQDRGLDRVGRDRLYPDWLLHRLHQIASVRRSKNREVLLLSQESGRTRNSLSASISRIRRMQKRRG